jgi:acetoin utilization deacetylase AcuC-like enzyme
VPDLILRIVYDDVHRLHADPSGRHPANPWRLEVALESLRESSLWSKVEVTGTPEASISLLELVHSSDYVRFIAEESRKGFHYLDADTYVTEHTFTISARFATAAYMAAIKSLESGEPWLIMPRPGGHHAGRSGWAMGAPTLGFCIFNYAAIAAKALEDRGLRVLVIDFDAHHGNGTQDVFWEDPKVVHIDVHQEAIYPGTGDVDDIGGGGAEGTKINIPLPAFSGDPQYFWFVEKVLEPVMEVFKPEAVVVSAGFDAYQGDPLTMLRATKEAYGHIAWAIRSQWIGGRIKALVINMEGGYGDGLRYGLREYVEVLLGFKEFRRAVEPREPPRRITEGLRRILGRYWGLEL